MTPVWWRTLLGAFLPLGATAYGGSAMMATLRQKCVERRHCLTEPEVKEGMAFLQLNAGATMMQMATFIGHHRRGVSGTTATGEAAGDNSQANRRVPGARTLGSRLRSKTATTILEPLHAGSAGAWISPRGSVRWRKGGTL
jgi:hypothetical protein